MLYLTGISISLFLSLLLVSKKNKTRADKILTIWLFLLSFHLLIYYLSFSPYISKYPYLFGLHFPMPFLHGPFLYLYALALTKKSPAFKTINLLHFLPAVLFYMLFIPFFIQSLEDKTAIVQSGGKGFQPFYSLSIVALIISGIVYVILTSIRLHRHRISILEQFSYTEKINLWWLQYLTYGIGLIWLIIIFSHDEVIFGAAAIFILFIGFFGIKQIGIFTQGNVFIEGYKENSKIQFSGNSDIYQIFTTKNNISTNENNADFSAENEGEIKKFKKYSKSGLTEESANQLHKLLKTKMDLEKLYIQTDLTLTTLAKRLNVPSNHLSQIINEKEGKNFYDYINTLRINAFIELISNSDNQKYTLLGLAFDCGFNSKSSFNKYFKKMTGISPSEYMDLKKTEKPTEITHSGDLYQS
ncbi:MAG: helix-turn-helix domain-containing protein [Bacteroidales bacterium]